MRDGIDRRQLTYIGPDSFGRMKASIIRGVEKKRRKMFAIGAEKVQVILEEFLLEIQKLMNKEIDEIVESLERDYRGAIGVQDLGPSTLTLQMRTDILRVLDDVDIVGLRAQSEETIKDEDVQDTGLGAQAEQPSEDQDVQGIDSKAQSKESEGVRGISLTAQSEGSARSKRSTKDNSVEPMNVDTTDDDTDVDAMEWTSPSKRY